MEIYHTLHDFMLHTEGVTYVLIVLALMGIAGFWRFLTGNDERTYKYK